LRIWLRKARLYRTRKKPGRSLARAALDRRSDRCSESYEGHVPHPLLFLISSSLKVEFNMKNRTDTLEIGSRAPEFSLQAANREGTFTLAGMLAQGTLVLEFLRGTW